MKVTQTLGPIISTIIYMFDDIATFLIIWMLVLFGFTMVGVLAFNEIDKLRDFESSLLYFVQASFGQFDLSIF